jgi:outer membrane protein
MTDSERLKQRQSLAETERDIARRQRALVEERNQRANEESQIILQRANRIIQDIAKKQKFDLIIQDAIWVSPKVDITEQVIKELNKPAK